MVDSLTALNAYKNQMKLSQNAGELGDSTQTQGPSFSDFLETQVQNVIDTQNIAEVAKMDALTGKGDVTDLVTAIANAELALNTIVTIRDRAISAYQDIIRMPI